MLEVTTTFSHNSKQFDYIKRREQVLLWGWQFAWWVRLGCREASWLWQSGFCQEHCIKLRIQPWQIGMHSHMLAVLWPCLVLVAHHSKNTLLGLYKDNIRPNQHSKSTLGVRWGFFAPTQMPCYMAYGSQRKKWTHEICNKERCPLHLMQLI